MSTHSGEIQNTYVQLITAPSSGANGTVKFHAQMYPKKYKLAFFQQ